VFAPQVCDPGPWQSTAGHELELRALAFETLKKRGEFLRIKGGQRWATPAFVLETRPRAATERNGQSPRFGFTITKKIGNAVTRNRVRRRFRALVTAIGPEKARPGYDYVIIARSGATERSYQDLRADLEQALNRVHQPRSRARRSKVPG